MATWIRRGVDSLLVLAFLAFGWSVTLATAPAAPRLEALDEQVRVAVPAQVSPRVRPTVPLPVVRTARRGGLSVREGSRSFSSRSSSGFRSRRSVSGGGWSFGK